MKSIRELLKEFDLNLDLSEKVLNLEFEHLEFEKYELIERVLIPGGHFYSFKSETTKLTISPEDKWNTIYYNVNNFQERIYNENGGIGGLYHINFISSFFLCYY